MGDVIIEAGQFAVQGTGNALTTFEVHHYGNVTVTGGNFSLARGSQGSGSGSTTWFMHEGDFVMSGATTQNSNPTPGQAKVVFMADGTQSLSFDEVTYGGGGFHFEVAETATLEISDGFMANGLVVNRGAISPLGALTFTASGVYDHARNGGEIPTRRGRRAPPPGSPASLRTPRPTAVRTTTTSCSTPRTSTPTAT
jgi:hypothetical protein